MLSAGWSRLDCSTHLMCLNKWFLRGIGRRNIINYCAYTCAPLVLATSLVGHATFTSPQPPSEFEGALSGRTSCPIILGLRPGGVRALADAAPRPRARLWCRQPGAVESFSGTPAYSLCKITEEIYRAVHDFTARGGIFVFHIQRSELYNTVALAFPLH
jgi:hypothetical protein